MIGQERSNRIAVGPLGANRDKLVLWIAQSCKLAAEDAPCIDIDCVIQPLGLWDWGMPIDHHSLASIIQRPVVPDGKTELVGLARRFPVKGEIADLGRPPALHVFFHPGMGNDELAVVQNVMTDESIEEPNDRFRASGSRFLGKRVELVQRGGKPMGDPDVLAPELFLELDVVVPRDAERRPCRDHVHHKRQDVQDPIATVDKIAHEHCLPTKGMAINQPSGNSGPRLFRLLVTQTHEQFFELIAASMDIADDVEGPVIGCFVVPKRNALDHGVSHLLDGVQDENVSKAFLS